jgi:hypothetical protein
MPVRTLTSAFGHCDHHSLIWSGIGGCVLEAGAKLHERHLVGAARKDWDAAASEHERRLRPAYDDISRLKHGAYFKKEFRR